MNNLHTQIVELAKNGIPPRQIAPMVRCKPDRVYSEIRKARSRGEDIPFFRTMSGPRECAASSVVLPNRIVALLTGYAEARQMTTGEAASSLLEAALLPKPQRIQGGADA